MNLTATCVRRPVLVAMIMAGLAGIGIFSYMQLPQQLFPDIDFPMVTVVTTYTGAGPEEIQELISKELEDEISTVEGIKSLRSISQQGMSIIIAEFYLGIDVDVAAADVRDRVNIARAALPPDADDPIVQKFDFGAEPVLLLAVSAPRSMREVFETADQRIKDTLSSVPGVASVTIVGGQEREVHVLADQQRLRAYGLSITDLIAAVAAANLEMPGGQIAQNSREYNIGLRGKFTSLEQLRNLPLTMANGDFIYLRDVAEVEDAYKKVREMARADGRTCVGITVQKRADGNTVAVDQAVRARIAELLEVLPEDYDITVQDEQATWITSSIANVFSNMYIGVLLTAAALFVFLHTFRSVLIVALTMPISVCATFIIMYLAGFSLNLMSLMGLAMTVGVLVNNAILVLENIVRYLDLDHAPDTAAVEGTNEIAVAVASTTLTNVVVFVPIAFMGGIVGEFFKDFGLTATFATIVSLFISFTLAPMMAAKLLRRNNRPARPGLYTRANDALARFFDRNLEQVRQAYEGALRGCLRRRFITVGVTLALFVGVLFLTGMVGAEFITPMDQGKFLITVEMPTGSRLAETDEAVRRIEALLMDPEILPELVSTYASIGRVTGGGVGGATQAVNIASINVTIVDRTQRAESTEMVINRLRPLLAQANIPGARIKMAEAAGEGGGEADVEMEIVGEDIEVVRAIADQAVALLNDPERIPGAIDVDTNFRLGQPEIRIIPDRDRSRDSHIDAAHVARVVGTTFEGIISSQYREGAYEYDIRIKADDRRGFTLADVQEMTVMNQAGDLIPLVRVADIVTTTGPAQLFRKDRQQLITVFCNVSGRSLGELVSDLNAAMGPVIEQYPGYHYTYAGQVEYMEESFGRLAVALIMAVCLTYMLLASLLESFIQPLLIMFSLPLSLIGVIGALWLMGGTFSIFSIMSIIMLVGLVINNAIVVLDYINLLRKQGVERTDAIVQAGSTRLRPILMANLTTIIALIPLAAGLGWGGEMRAPMAMVQIGGLVAGGWLGLLVVPVIYTLSDDFNHWVLRLLQVEKKPARAADAAAGA